MQKNDNSNKWLFITALSFLILDQATKLYFKGFSFYGIEHDGLQYGVIEVIGDFVKFVYVENPGMAFGMKFIPKIFLSLFSIFAGIGLAIYLHRLKGYSIWVRIGIMLIFAGAAGNLIDRVFYGVIFNEQPSVFMMNPIDKFVYQDIFAGVPIFYGHVVDFIQVDIPDINILGLYYTHWPVFNVADSCVSVGVVLLLIVHHKIPPFGDVFGKEKNIVENPQPPESGDTEEDGVIHDER